MANLTTDVINNILGIKESYQASDTLMKILFDKEKREKVFREFLEYEKNLDFDWFHIYFEEEHANKLKFAQDFTPDSISKIVSRIVAETARENNSMTLDTAAGTGSLTIQKWNDDRLKVSSFDYRPSNYFYRCEELSDRALPFLIFNLMVRGMNAIVIHGDALNREAKQVYFIQNDEDDHMMFSSLNVMPHSRDVEKEFDIRHWLEEAIDHKESSLFIERRE